MSESSSSTRTRALEIVLENNRNAKNPKTVKQLIDAAEKVAAYIADGTKPAPGARPDTGDGELETRDE